MTSESFADAEIRTLQSIRNNNRSNNQKKLDDVVEHIENAIIDEIPTVRSGDIRKMTESIKKGLIGRPYGSVSYPDVIDEVSKAVSGGTSEEVGIAALSGIEKAYEFMGI